MGDMTGSAGVPESGPWADESSLSFPPGASKSERVEIRLDIIENSGRLVIARGSRAAHIARVVLSVGLGLLGLLVLLLGAEGLIALAGFVLFGLFSVVFPIIIIRRHGQDHRLEMSPDGFELIRCDKDSQVTVDRAKWENVSRVSTAKFGNQPESPDFPVVDVFSSAGAGSGLSVFNRNPHGARIVLNQPLEVGRWELYELLVAAHQRFRSTGDSVTDDRH